MIYFKINPGENLRKKAYRGYLYYFHRYKIMIRNVNIYNHKFI